MFLPINIEDLLNKQKVESNRIEFKKGWNPESIYHSICAFANDFENIGGGYILVGVEEENGVAKRPVVGLNVSELDKIQKDMVGYDNKIDPYYMARKDVVEIDGKQVLAIWVPTGINRPYSIPGSVVSKKQSDRKWYVRNGTSSIEAKGEVLDELRDMASRTPFDERGNPDISVSDISPAYVLDYLQSVKSKLVEGFDKMTFANVLDQMDLFVGPSEKRMLKNVAAMMFCPDLNKFFPTSQVEIVVFPEGRVENPDNMIEVPKIYGTVPSMIKQTLDYIRTNVIKKRIIKPKDKAESITYFNYPYQAIEEAVVNALYHRDYREREPVEITIEPNEITILSYSGPDRSISLDTVKKAQVLKSRRYRNRRLGDYLKMLRLAEGRATGIPTIQNELRINGSGQARIDTDEGRSYFLIEIPCREGFDEIGGIESNEVVKGKLSKLELAIVKEIAKNPNLKRKQLMEALNVTQATLARNLKLLQSDSFNLIEYRGSCRTGGYVVTEKGKSILKI